MGREQIRQYANSVQAAPTRPPSTPDAAAELGHDGLVAPLTFMSILAVMIQRHFFQHVDVGFETMQIVQVDQKFKVQPADRRGRHPARHHAHRVPSTSGFGADIVTSRNVLTDERTGEVVMESFTTLMGHEGDNSISAGWDPEDRAGAAQTRHPRARINTARTVVHSGPSGFPTISAVVRRRG